MFTTPACNVGREQRKPVSGEHMPSDVLQREIPGKYRWLLNEKRVFLLTPALYRRFSAIRGRVLAVDLSGAHQTGSRLVGQNQNVYSAGHGDKSPSGWLSDVFDTGA